MAEDTEHVAKAMIFVEDEEKKWLLLSRKRASGKKRYKKLEMPGGHLNQGETPLEGMIRELGEEEETRLLSRRVQALKPPYLEFMAGGAPHFLFEFTITKDEFTSLRHCPKESFGFELVDPAKLKEEPLYRELTPRTRAILKALEERRPA